MGRARRLAVKTAAGADGVPDALFIAMRKAEGRARAAFRDREGRDAPRAFLTPLGRLVELAAREFWLRPGDFADLNVGVVHPILKKGAEDALDPASYRPITIVPALPKLVAGVAADALRESLRGSLSPAQAAFLGKEECEAQAFSLLELCARRYVKLGRPTYVVFLDVSKAFDTVPHWAIAEGLADPR